MITGITTSIKSNLYFLLVLLLSLLLRIFWLNNFPISITHDEMEYIMQAKSIFYTGQGIPTAPLFGILSWGQHVSGNVLAELPSFLIAPLIGPFASSQFLARLPYALLSSFTVIIIYSLFKILTGNKNLALLASLVLAVNPWSIHFGRTSFEFTFSVFFYLTAVYLVARNNKWNILYSLPLFLAGFFSYHGAKFLFLPLILVVCSWKFFAGGRKSIKQLLLVCIVAIFISFSYFITIKYQPASSRVGELIFNSSTVSSEVDNERRLSVPGLQQELFLNKATYFLKELGDTYLHAFSTDFLFVSGENRGAYSFWIHGLFYIIDFPFIILGLIGLYMVNKKSWLIVIMIIALSPLTSVISGGQEKSYVIRSGLMFPLIASLSGIGIWYLLNQIKNFRFLIGGIVLVVYFLSVANFINLYLTRYPIYNSEGFFFSDKLLSKYVELASDKSEQDLVTISVKEPRILFEKFLFYNNLYSKESALEINQKVARNDFSYRNVKFVDTCSQMSPANNSTLIYDSRLGCEEETQPVSRILSPADAGSLFVIKNDRLCNSYNLSRYPRVDDIFKFDVYKLTEEDFCKTWISLL